MDWLVTNTVSSKRELMTTDELLALEHGCERYTSQFCYGPEMREHIIKNGSYRSYTGPVHGHHYCVDIDTNKGVEGLKGCMVPLLEDMDRIGIDYRLYFSGFKGFHLYVPKQYIGVIGDAEGRHHVASKSFALALAERYPDIAPFIDMGVYDGTRLLRSPFSLYPINREKKKDYESVKKLLVYNQFTGEITYLQDFDMAKELAWVFRGAVLDEDVEQWFDMALDEQRKDGEPAPVLGGGAEPHEYVYGEKMCITHMLNDRVCDNSRHNTALRLISYWKEKGLPKRTTEKLLADWNEQLDPHFGKGPMDASHLESLMKHYNTKTYTYTCEDTVKKKHCQASCFLYRVKDTVSGSYVYTGETYLDKYQEMLNMATTNDIRVHEIWKQFMPLTIKPDAGHIVVIAGGPAAGKTSFAANLMLRTKHIDWLFMSYELTGADFAETVCRIGNITDITNPEQRARFNSMVSHIATIDDPVVKVTDLESVIDMIKERNGLNIKGVVIDYLQHSPAPGANATEKAIAIARALRGLAKKKRVAVIALSQVPKELAGDSNEPLPMSAPKDSGEITSAADIQLNVWRPGRNKPNRLDDTLHVFVAKGRKQEECYGVDLEFRKAQSLIL